MPKAGELDWSSLMKGDVGEPEHPLSKPLDRSGPILKKGEVPTPQSDEEIRKVILSGTDRPGFKQATDQELFGHLVVPKEELEKMEKKWEGTINNWFQEASKAVGDKVAPQDWASGQSFNSTLSQEELKKRNMYVDRDE